MRACKKCRRTKLLREFPPYRVRGKEGRRHVCRECWNARWTPIVEAHNSRYYHENKGGYRERQKARTNRQHQTKREDRIRRNREYAMRHPLRAAAKQAVMIAVRSGRLVPESCQVCGAAAGKTHGHHDDYSKPVNVIWLCPIHHGERHRLINRRIPSDQWPPEWPHWLPVREFPV